MRVAPPPPARHPTVPVRELRGADEPFLWVTAAQRARPAIRELIHDGDAPAGSPAPVRRPRAARAGADHDEIEGLRHVSRCVYVGSWALLLAPGVQHLPRLVCEALRIVLRIGAIEFSCVRILQIVWSRRLGTVPAGLSSIQHEAPGAWPAQGNHPVVAVGQDPMPFPVWGCPRVGHELSDLPDVLLAAAVFRCPDDVDPEARIVHGREDSSLSLLRAPQAPAARRAYVHHQAYRSAGGVELGLERLGGAVEGREVGCRGDQPRRHRAGEQQARHSVPPLFSQNSVTNRFTATAASQTVALTQSTSRVARPARTPHAAPGRTRHPQYAPQNASTSSRNEPARMYQR